MVQTAVEQQELELQNVQDGRETQRESGTLGERNHLIQKSNLERERGDGEGGGERDRERERDREKEIWIQIK